MSALPNDDDTRHVWDHSIGSTRKNCSRAYAETSDPDTTAVTITVRRSPIERTYWTARNATRTQRTGCQRSSVSSRTTLTHRAPSDKPASTSNTTTLGRLTGSYARNRASDPA